MKSKNLRYWIIISFWLLIALINLTQNLLSAYANQYNLTLAQILAPQLAWFIWMAFTPFVLILGDKIPVTDKLPDKNLILKYLFYSVLISLAHFICESGLGIILSLFLTSALPPLKFFAGLIAYKFHLHLIICFLILSVSYAINYFNRYRTSEIEKAKLELKNEQLKNQLSQAELLTLKMQIHPHFLFNTHNTISSLVLEGKNNEAVKMIVSLSDMLRLTLENGSENMVPLCRELEIIKLYLSIHENRFNDRLRIIYKIDPGTDQLLIPGMILQPLVENAIKHGFSKSSGDCIIEINTVINDNCCYIKIENTGNRLSTNYKEGNGLKITKERLNLIYKSNFSFLLYSSENKTICELHLPVNGSN